MELHLILATDDPEHTYGVFDNIEVAAYVCANKPECFDELVIKSYEIGNNSADDIYYFVVNEDNYVIADECFSTKEDALQYVEDNGLSNRFEIHGHKLNTIYDGGTTSVDKNGEPIEPSENDKDYSLYYLYQDMKKNNMNIKWFETVYIQE